ncbi:hypothetical protein FFF34_009450 [Inquilinus sp. KBS0705]|nr:hypothetical protein FFF34_009450 [Inquilinus sp. KBS0705]
MADQTNNPITDDNIKKAKDYKDALDNLKGSINGLNSKLPEFADGIKSGLKAIGEKLPDVVDSLIKLNAQNKELAESGQKPKSILKELASSMFSWNAIISVGVTLLASYSGAIIDWVSNLLKGETRLSSFGKAMKDNAIITDGIIQTRIKGTQSAQAELTALNSLYRATQNHNLSLEDRKKVIGALREQWPQSFKNTSDETIIAGKAGDAYKYLKEQILATAYAEAYKNKITANATRSIDNEQKITTERANNLTLLSKRESLEKEIDERKVKIKNELDKKMFDKSSRVLYGDIYKLNEQIEASDKIIYNLFTDNDLLNKQNRKFEQGIDTMVEKYGTNTLTDNKSTNTTTSTTKTGNSPDAVQNFRGKSDSHQNSQPGMELIKISDFISAKFELQINSYKKETDELKKQREQKIISQDEYYTESRKLEEKYRLGIGELVKIWNEDDLEKTLQHQQDLVEAQKQSELISSDEKAINNALVPGSKLEAEKKLITDKYNFEIQKAAEAGQDTAEIRKQYEQEITATIQQYEQQRKEFALNTAQQVSDKAFSIISNNIKSQSDAKIKGLEAQKTSELSNTSLTATQRKAIEDKYKQKEAQEKVKAFKAEQRASVLQAIVNGALAITKATSQTGILAPFVIPGIIASTALQVATIVAQKPPAYARGGHFVSDGRGAVLPGYSRTDNTNAFLRSGEAVVVSEAMRNPWARNLVSAINVAHGGRDFSVPNTGRGYAIGGIYTDGGNANRYYNQTVNDIQDMANTLAYQMINNFPPIYVDVKDVNNQQNILAQTVNRVNL